MFESVVWALATGFITGGVSVAVVMLERVRRLARRGPYLPPEIEDRLVERETVKQELAETRERLAFAERVMAQQEIERRSSASDEAR